MIISNYAREHRNTCFVAVGNRHACSLQMIDTFNKNKIIIFYDEKSVIN